MPLIWRPPIETAVTATVVILAALGLSVQLRALAAPLHALIDKYKDALLAISGRADKAEKLADALNQTLAAFERAVGDKRALEQSLASEREQTAFLRERVTELQRALLALTNKGIEAQVVGQTFRASEPPDSGFIPGPTRWQAASGAYSPVEPLVHTLTKNNPSTTFRGADLRVMQSVSGPHLPDEPAS